MNRILSAILLVGMYTLQGMEAANPANPRPGNNTLDFFYFDEGVADTVVEMARFCMQLQPTSLLYINPRFDIDKQSKRAFFDPLFDTDEYDPNTEDFFDNLTRGNFDLRRFGKLSPRTVSVLIHMIAAVKKLAQYDYAQEANPYARRVAPLVYPDRYEVREAYRIEAKLSSPRFASLLDYLNAYQHHESFNNNTIYTVLRNYINSQYKVEQREVQEKLRPRSTMDRGNKFIFPELPSLDR
jgi:hypothetical protein